MYIFLTLLWMFHVSTMTSELYCRPVWCPVPCLTLILAVLNVFSLGFFKISVFLQRYQNHRAVSNGSKSALLLATSCRGGTAVTLPCYSSFDLIVIHLCINMFCTTGAKKLPRKVWQSLVMSGDISAVWQSHQTRCVVRPGAAQTPECGLVRI